MIVLFAHTYMNKYNKPLSVYRFHCRANLKSHIKVHSDKKSYICDLCGFKCKQSTGLRVSLRLYYYIYYLESFINHKIMNLATRFMLTN